MFHHLLDMTLSLARLAPLMSTIALLVCACGGSSSETPWPAEPIDLEPGPAGEERVRGNVVDTKKLPDNYTKQQQEREKKKDGSENGKRRKQQAAPNPEPTSAPEAPAPKEE